ncbi:MAG: hypothetical protein ABFC73_10355 [Clostridiaceae bacterium]
MDRYLKTETINAPSNRCCQALAEAFKKMEIEVLQFDEATCRMQGRGQIKGDGRFQIEVKCNRINESETEVELRLESSWNMRLEKASDLFLINLRRAVGLPGSSVDIGQLSKNALRVFAAYEQIGFSGVKQWVGILLEDKLVFHDPATERNLIIPREQARDKILFTDFMKMQEETTADIAGVRLNLGQNKSLIQDWMPLKGKNNMKLELRICSGIAAALGIFALLQPDVVYLVCGGLLILFAVLAFFVPRRGMFLLLGISLIITGVVYIITITPSSGSFYMYYCWFLWLVGGSMVIRTDKYNEKKRVK